MGPRRAAPPPPVGLPPRAPAREARATKICYCAYGRALSDGLAQAPPSSHEPAAGPPAGPALPRSVCTSGSRGSTRRPLVGGCLLHSEAHPCSSSRGTALRLRACPSGAEGAILQARDQGRPAQGPHPPARCPATRLSQTLPGRLHGGSAKGVSPACFLMSRQEQETLNKGLQGFQRLTGAEQEAEGGGWVDRPWGGEGAAGCTPSCRGRRGCGSTAGAGARLGEHRRGRGSPFGSLGVGTERPGSPTSPEAGTEASVHPAWRPLPHLHGLRSPRPAMCLRTGPLVATQSPREQPLRTAG